MSNHESQGPSVVIVGSGHGLRVHLPALRQVGFNVVGLVGSDRERTQRRADKNIIPQAFTDLDEALTVTGANAVTVASPPTTHAEQVLTALKHGCHVMCEKPFASNAEEARRVLVAAEAARVVHVLGNQMRSRPERIVGATAIAEGLIGDPRYLSFVQHTNLLANTAVKWPDWWFDEAAGGGWLNASGSHMIDHIRSWLGDFESLSAVLPITADRKNVTEDTFNVRFTMANGVEGLFTQTAAAWGPMAEMTRVVGTKGTLWVQDGELMLADIDGTRQLEIPEELKLLEMEPSEDPRKRFLHVELPPSVKLFEAWRSAIENQSSVTPFASFSDGLAAMEVIDAVRKSAREGGQLIKVKAVK